MDEEISYICTLDHSCRCKREENKCNDYNNKCGFRVLIHKEPDTPKVYVRKERWYEKYYKDSRRLYS